MDDNPIDSCVDFAQGLKERGLINDNPNDFRYHYSYMLVSWIDGNPARRAGLGRLRINRPTVEAILAGVANLDVYIYIARDIRKLTGVNLREAFFLALKVGNSHILSAIDSYSQVLQILEKLRNEHGAFTVANHIGLPKVDTLTKHIKDHDNILVYEFQCSLLEMCVASLNGTLVMSDNRARMKAALQGAQATEASPQETQAPVERVAPPSTVAESTTDQAREPHEKHKGKRRKRRRGNTGQLHEPSPLQPDPVTDQEKPEPASRTEQGPDPRRHRRTQPISQQTMVFGLASLATTRGPGTAPKIFTFSIPETLPAESPPSIETAAEMIPRDDEPEQFLPTHPPLDPRRPGQLLLATLNSMLDWIETWNTGDVINDRERIGLIKLCERMFTLFGITLEKHDQLTGTETLMKTKLFTSVFSKKGP